jgi:hypothetical protein
MIWLLNSLRSRHWCLNSRSFNAEFLQRLQQCGSTVDDTFFIDRVSNSILVEADVWHRSFCLLEAFDYVVLVVGPVTDDEVVPHPLRHHLIFLLKLFYLHTLTSEVLDVALVF